MRNIFNKSIILILFIGLNLGISYILRMYFQKYLYLHMTNKWIKNIFKVVVLIIGFSIASSYIFIELAHIYI